MAQKKLGENLVEDSSIVLGSVKELSLLYIEVSLTSVGIPVN